MGKKRQSYKRRITNTDRRRDGAIQIIAAMGADEHLRALAQLDRAIKNGTATRPTKDDQDTPPT